MVGFLILLILQLCFTFLFFQLCMYLFEHRIPAYNIEQRKLVGVVYGESAEL